MNAKTKDPRALWEQLQQYGMIVVGALIYSLGQLFFIKPLHIPMGGVAGISLVANYLWSLPVGLCSIVLNLPLFFLGWRTLGRQFFYKTAFATVCSAVFLDLLAGVIPAFQGEMLIAALYGGIVMGAGFGIIFRAGGTSGGTDIIAKWLNKKRDTPIGTVNFSFNIVIISASALIYGNPDSALYAIMASFLSSQVIDKLVYGVDVQKEAMIITDKPREVSRAIMEKLGHGVTAMEGKGMYTGDRRTVLICAVRRHESGTLKKLLLEEDENAFMMLSNINEVFGKGFKHLQQ
ncbi:MAG: YitT family protein [Clostridia bacterium]|nr:YitT family protein [Clostridia bacterium]